MTTRLKLIDRPATPEDELRLLFRREAELAGELTEVQKKISRARFFYMAKHRTFGLRIETLRGLFG